MEYAAEVKENLVKRGIRCELDDRNEKIGYKIRDWEMHKAPYMLIVGEKEMKQRAVSVRKHREGDKGAQPLEEFANECIAEIQNKQL
jgi:threonyl-tRNA synthetase